MAYLLNDIYSASGSAKLFGCWTEGVTKFHPGSFYNYEQDNMPLFDLDERDELLWEQLGYPTSSIPGMVLLVSADAPAAVVGCNKNIFYDLSSALKVLPKYLNYPLIIEVASFGDLGELVIRDVTMGPSGSLEIINRPTFGIPIVSGVECSAGVAVATGPHAEYGTLFKNVSAGTGDTLFNFFTNYPGGSPSSLMTSESIFSGVFGNGIFDSRFTTGVYKGFYGTRAGDQLTPNQEFTRLSVGNLEFPQTFSTKFEVSSNVYEETPSSEISVYDPSAYLQYTLGGFSNETYRSYNYTPGANSSYLRFVAYGNNVNKIVVSDCNGPIYIRGFYCSGNGSTTQTGVHVSDSTVDFDTLAVDHFVNKGINIKNSTVTFKRDLFVNRCYGLDNSSNRKSGRWDTVNRLSFDPILDDSAGIEATNSEIFFDTTEDHTKQLGTFRASNFLRVISRNSTGLRLINSTVRGGSGRPTSALVVASGLQEQDYLFVEGNANYGVELENSRFRFDGRLEVFGNTRGVKATNSKLNINEFTIDNNHIYGLNLQNSNFTYNTNGTSALDRFDYITDTLVPQNTYTKQYTYKFKANGQHLLMSNSTFNPNKYTLGMENYHGRLVLIEAHGVSDESLKAALPGIEINNSVAELINITSLRTGIDNKPADGAHIYARNNSEVVCLGTVSSICGFLAGSATPAYDAMKKYSAITVEDNSTIRFRGPNVIYDGAVNVYANKNSNIIFEPHKKSNGQLDVQGYTLSNARAHTMIELKSYKSCLVADRSSNIHMEDLGDYNTLWAASDIVDTNYDTSNGSQITPYVSAGFFQFYPNPNEESDYTDFPEVLSARGNSCRLTSTGSNKFYFGLDHWNASTPFDFSGITQGGICLRALNQSNVRVRNVHFPCGWWNASATYYDTSANEFCCRLFIWNVGNNSTMHVDHVSVSGVYPASAGYHGPSAIWPSGASEQYAGYGAPSSTPDTSSLSILDFFGCGSGYPNAWPLPDGTSAMYGQLTFENQGPYRLYRGVDSFANQLVYGGGFGMAPQLFAQGYALSADAYPGDADISGVYGKALRITDAGALQTSGFYYANEFVDSDPNAIILDESGANLFANAKNGAMGTSNRPRICMIYSAKTNQSGEARTSSAGIKGKGFKSSNIFDLLEEN